MGQSGEKKRLVFSIVLLVMMFLTFPIFGATTKLVDLINEPDIWDGKNITVEGEVIGDVMMRGDHAWINVSDGSGVMGIWIAQEDAQKIKITGDYKHIGDLVQIQGIFHESFTEQGGDMAIAGETLNITQEGITVVRPVSNSKVFWAIGLTLLVVILNWGRIMIWTKQKFKWKK